MKKNKAYLHYSFPSKNIARKNAKKTECGGCGVTSCVPNSIIHFTIIHYYYYISYAIIGLYAR